MFVFLLFFLAVSFSTASKKVCYPPYGCFSTDAPFNRAFVQLPEKFATNFLYYSRKNPTVPDWLNPLAPKSPSRAKFDPSKHTVMFTHGYIESRNQWYIQLFIDEMLKIADMNIILCEWSGGSAFPYHQAAGNARLVGAQMSYMIQVIRNDTGLDMDKFHVVGFSLGSHVVGFAGRNLKEKGITLKRITALDPAAPYFEFEHVDVRLDPSDADFVDVLHTDTKTLLVNGFGTVQEMGHLDFFPNGGYHQVGCGKLDVGVVEYLACSHYRSMRYFLESINGKCPFYGYPCPSYKDFRANKCTSCGTAGCPRMGFHAVKPAVKPNTKFYLKTHTGFPFCGYHYRLSFHTGNTYFADLAGAVTIKLIGSNRTSTVELPSHSYDGGSVETRVVLIKEDIGELKKIKVTHNRLIDAWKLIGVKIKPMWQSKEYTGCYNRWLNNKDNVVAVDVGLSMSSCRG